MKKTFDYILTYGEGEDTIAVTGDCYTLSNIATKIRDKAEPLQPYTIACADFPELVFTQVENGLTVTLAYIFGIHKVPEHVQAAVENTAQAALEDMTITDVISIMENGTLAQIPFTLWEAEDLCGLVRLYAGDNRSYRAILRFMEDTYNAYCTDENIGEKWLWERLTHYGNWHFIVRE